MATLLDILQGASNAAAGNVSGPVDMLSWALRKAGLGGIVGDVPVGGSAWMAQKGLTKQPQNPYAGGVGEFLGMAGPIGVAAKAPQIAAGLLRGGENLAAPSTLRNASQRGIVPASFVRGQGGKASLPTDQVFADAVANTPGAQVSPDGLLMRLQRNQAPEQGMRESVRGGVFYLPEGAAQAKHYSTGKNGYGGSERIAGETLIQNPLFVKGATGGKAPQAAFDQLRGKGAYDAMRSEALSAIGYGSRKDPEKVYAFLDKYAPELANHADYIISNSSKGNQLAYALQEAAVGSATRNAGHDAVLGYSKQRTGSPFISEVFDTRERLYPDKFGGFGVWDKTP